MRLVIEGTADRIAVIKKRFRGFGVKFIDEGGSTATAGTVYNDPAYLSMKLENDHLKSVLKMSKAMDNELIEAKAEIESLKAKLNGPPVLQEELEPIQKAKGKSKK